MINLSARTTNPTFNRGFTRINTDSDFLPRRITEITKQKNERFRIPAFYPNLLGLVSAIYVLFVAK
jgi:hypothetical protein